jgi:hypothetical protein
LDPQRADLEDRVARTTRCRCRPARSPAHSKHGRIELCARASADPQTMVALWIIGYEDEPERSAEI